MAFSTTIPEEQLKNEVAQTVFRKYNCARIIGKIDFAVYPKAPKSVDEDTLIPLLWAEAKKGSANLEEALIQLLLTIGKARTYNARLTPKYLAAFNAEEIVFIPYAAVHPVYGKNDFNWNVPPSDHSTKEFQELSALVQATIAQTSARFPWHKPGSATTLDPALRLHIQQNFHDGPGEVKILIDHNNFLHIYLHWRLVMLPHKDRKGRLRPGAIDVQWDTLRKRHVLDSDFFLADLFVDDKDTDDISDDETIREDLLVSFRSMGYTLAQGAEELLGDIHTFRIQDREAYTHFWKRYKRPPKEQSQQEIIDRRDLLVPPDIRERKGSFFTPQQWVQLSQQYLADSLGDSWQDEYYVWDCAAGTGNLLVGLTHPERVWASTLDLADVLVIHDRIHNGALLRKDHVFQFDFLNDPFSKLPAPLREIVEDEEKRKKLVIYINPPYAEATNARTKKGSGTNRSGLATGHAIRSKYAVELGKASNELFAQFFIRIYKEIPGCIIGEFSTSKILLSKNFSVFRTHFQPKLQSAFLVPGNTFDNVKGDFPIGFFIWDSKQKEPFTSINADVYGDNGLPYSPNQKLIQHINCPLINSWHNTFLCKNSKNHDDIQLGFLAATGNDFQHQQETRIISSVASGHMRNSPIYTAQLIPTCIYFAVRLCIKADWLNDRDQLLYPNEDWLADPEFQTDCLAFTLLHGQNRVSAEEGTNHWIPFTEAEVGLKGAAYDSHFMLDFIEGQLPAKAHGDTALLDGGTHGGYPTGQSAIAWSEEAKALLDAGRALYTYYLRQYAANPNASYYDIRKYFQGANDATGRMNPKSDDQEYNRLIAELRAARKRLGDEKIAPKVYAYGFLMG